MKWIIAAFAAVALLAAVETMHPRPSPVDISLGSAAMPSLLARPIRESAVFWSD
jgi:hypothetical protein